MKQKIVALPLCLFFGWLGAHKFYLGQTGWGIAYLLFFWTCIPFIAALVEFLILVFMSEEDFNRRFNPHLIHSSRLSAGTSASDITQALRELKSLYESGIITPEEYEEKRRNLLRQL